MTNVAAPPPYAEQKSELELSESRLSGPLSLTMDGQLIYPTTPPATALYQTSRTLDMPGSSVSISRLGPHKFNKPSMLSAGATSPQKLEGFDSDKAIYEIIRTPLVLTKLELKGKRRSTLPGSIKMERGLWSWKTWHEHKGSRTLLFRATPNTSTKKGLGLRWMDAGGQVLAMERLEIDGDRSSRPIMAFEKDLEPATQDLLVACWCAKVWAASQFPMNNGNNAMETRKSYNSCLAGTLHFEEYSLLT